MALPTSYLVTTKRVNDIFNAIKTAKAPDRFSQKILENLGFKSTNDRLIIGVLKALNFIDDLGKPTKRYYEFLDQTQSSRVLAEGIRDAYKDLYSININAHTLNKNEIINKFKTLSEGKLSDTVLDHMARTFQALVKLADFESIEYKPPISVKALEKEEKPTSDKPLEASRSVKLGGLVYNIQIVLPESRDPAVYDALFKSLKEHLL